ncbi:tetratricopeptide repeat protein [Alkalimonas collagenimarina]|uniref:Tetratricopeptide repeat protein n=1 Tax=Alkalimonas collagenimarina TaxID=400390 RepID=A0ABT9GZV6_9GAMM|nr:tetratricopeptide repeat protein [Alkalimonas collagenimarina]MDP4536582.1 tetratricopeptide repeat protein [Alkalimonas collagenimarina]
MMKQFTKLTSALALMIAVAGAGFYSPVSFAETAAQKQQRIQERKDRRSQAVSERTGRAVTQAFELYQEDQVREALVILEGARTSSDFDRAFVDRYIGQMNIGLDDAKALDYLKRAAAPDILSFADQSQLLELIAQLHLNAEQYQQSIDAYQVWMHFTGEEKHDVYYRIAAAYQQLNQYDRVLDPVNRAIALSSEPREPYYTLKFASLYEGQQIPQAVAVLEEMVQIFPESAQWWFYLGNTYQLQEQYEKALSALRVANLLGFIETQSHYQMLGQMYANNEMQFKAADIFDKQIKAGVINDSRQLLLATASNYQAAREYAKAAEFYGKLGQKENDAEAYRRQGEAYLSIQRYRDAVTAFNKALELNVDNAGRVHMSLVSAHFYQEQYPQALAAVTQARRDSSLSRQARSWENYIREKAQQKGVNL